jgi:hypothetical protein
MDFYASLEPWEVSKTGEYNQIFFGGIPFMD